MLAKPSTLFIFRKLKHPCKRPTPENQAEDYPENPLQEIRQREIPDLQEVMSSLSLDEIKKKLNG